MRILNFGSLNIDTVFSVSHAAAPGESLAVTDPQIHAGGKGLNQSIAAARAGADVYHAGRVGSDGEFLLQLLKQDGVNTSCVTLDAESRNGGAIIQVEPEGRNTMLIYGGANRRLTREQIEMTLGKFTKGDFLMMQNETNLSREILHQAYFRGMFTIYNPSPITQTIYEMPYEEVSLLIVNEDEGAALAGGEYPPEEMLQRLTAVCPNQVILTLGKSGSLAVSEGEIIRQSIFPVEAVYSTGAGDTFAGYIAASLSRGVPMVHAMQMAAAASAISVTRHGAAASIPTLNEVKAFLSQNAPQ